MTCWQTRFSDASAAAAQAEDARINKAIEELKRSILAAPMAGDALSELLRADVGMSKVRTRVAVDGHDIEVELQDGLWRVLDPWSLTVKELNASNLAHNSNEYVGIFNTTTHTDFSILRDSSGSHVRSNPA